MASNTNATMPTMPSFSSDHTMERVLGTIPPWRLHQSRIDHRSRQERSQVLVVGFPQVVGMSFERDRAVLQHAKFGFRLRGRLAGIDADVAVCARRTVCRYVERVAQLMRHQH